MARRVLAVIALLEDALQFHLEIYAGPLRPRSARTVRVLAATSDAELSTPQTAALVLGAVFNPVVLLSEYVLVTTGQGLDPGPGGLYGAAEGIGA